MNDSMPDLVSVVGDSKSQFSVINNAQENVSMVEPTLRNTENQEDVIRTGLARYELGAKLRALRLKKKIALVDLGRHTGLSPSMLSQLENGKLVPTLPTLSRIAMVFDVGLEHFFSDRRSRRIFSVTRAGERIQFPEDANSAIPGYFFEVLAFGAIEKSMSAYLAEFPLREPSEVHPHTHDGAEFIHVLEGVLALNYQSEDHVLRAGDSVYFDGAESHSYHGQSEMPARAIIIVTTPQS